MKKISIFLGCAFVLSLFIFHLAYAQWYGFSNPYDFGPYNSYNSGYYNYGYPYSGYTQPNYGYSWNQPYSYGWNQPYNYGWNQPYGYDWGQSYTSGWSQPFYGGDANSYLSDAYRYMYPSYYPGTYEYQNTYHWINDPINGNQYVPFGYGNPYARAKQVPGGYIVPGQGFVAAQGMYH